MFFTVLACLVPSHIITSASETQRYFQLQSNPPGGPVRLGDPWVARTRTSCAHQCMTAFENCTSFLFSPPTGLCTPSAHLDQQQPPPSPGEGHFFQSF